MCPYAVWLSTAYRMTQLRVISTKHLRWDFAIHNRNDSELNVNIKGKKNPHRFSNQVFVKLLYVNSC